MQHTLLLSYLDLKKTRSSASMQLHGACNYTYRMYLYLRTYYAWGLLARVPVAVHVVCIVYPTARARIARSSDLTSLNTQRVMRARASLALTLYSSLLVRWLRCCCYTCVSLVSPGSRALEGKYTCCTGYGGGAEKWMHARMRGRTRAADACMCRKIVYIVSEWVRRSRAFYRASSIGWRKYIAVYV